MPPYFWPIVIAVCLLGVAYVLFYALPQLIDTEMSFLWIVAGFLALYVGAALYLSHSLPAFGKIDNSSTEKDGAIEITVPDVVVK